MSGHLPATRAPAIRTGSWLAPEAPTDILRYGRLAIACCALALLCTTAAIAARNRFKTHPPPQHARQLPYPQLEWPIQSSGTQYESLAWSDMPGSSDDGHIFAYKTFR